MYVPSFIWLSKWAKLKLWIRGFEKEQEYLALIELAKEAGVPYGSIYTWAKEQGLVEFDDVLADIEYCALN